MKFFRKIADKLHHEKTPDNVKIANAYSRENASSVNNDFWQKTSVGNKHEAEKEAEKEECKECVKTGYYHGARVC